MTTTKKASQAGARRVIATFDAMASLVQFHGAALNIPKKVAMDFAYRCDMVSDHLGRQLKAGYFDPSEIGVEQTGPLQYDNNNPFMAGEFTQEEKRTLSEKQMAGQLAANAAKGVADPKLASVVKKAAYEAAMAAFKKAAEEAKPEEEKKEADEGEKEEEVAKKAAAYNAARKQAKQTKKAEEEEEKEEDDEEEKEEEEPKEEKSEEADKTARLFQLFR
jgi:hypothetical protein